MNNKIFQENVYVQIFISTTQDIMNYHQKLKIIYV